MMADQFKLPDAFEEAVVQLSRLTMVELNELEKSVAISPTLSCEILKRRVGTFETNACEPVSSFADSNIGWSNVGPMSVLSSRRWAGQR